MECVVVAIFVVLLGLLAIFSLGIPAADFFGVRRGVWNDAFRHVAQRFHGVLNPGGWFHEPSAWIQHGMAHGRLTIFSLRGSVGERCLQMTIQQRDLTCRCEIYHHQARGELVPQPRGLAEMEFDWADCECRFGPAGSSQLPLERLDGAVRGRIPHERWKVLAADADEVRHLLSDGVRLAIDQLWRHPTPAELAISLSPGWLTVRKVWNSPRGVEIEEFVERVCALSDQLNLAAASGIEFLVSERAQLLEEARCGVCGDGLASDLVVCRRCNTPHHRECWQYGGGCATYACGGRDCHVPGIAPLAAPHWDAANALDRLLKPR